MSISNPSTFLELAQRASIECGVSSSGPASLLSATGIDLLMKGWVSESWVDIQRMHDDWHFMRRSANFQTVNGLHSYTPAQCGVTNGGIGKWQRETMRNFHTASGIGTALFMDYLDYDEWRDAYLFGSQRDVRTRPTVFAVNPFDHGLSLGPVPTAEYTITGDYFLRPSALENDADVPSLPAQYMMAIVYKAMMEYGAYDAAPEVYSRGEKRYNEIIRQLEDERLNEVEMGGALA